jgi:hypothetical protein
VLFSTRVGRFVVRLGAEYTADDDGFRSNSAWWSTSEQHAVADIPSETSIAVLGEPGIGKTTAIDELVHGDSPVVVIHLDEVTDVRLLEDQLNRVRSSANPGASATLVLDGLDECPIPAKALIRHVYDVVRGHPSLRVVVGCRTADWPVSFGEGLQSLPGGFEAFELLPLAREDVAALAAERGVDGDTFVRAVVDASAVPLATLPLTLDLLLTIYTASGALPTSATELYERGLLVLAEDPDPDRGSGSKPTGTASQRLATAAKIAAYTMLCGRSAVSTAAPPAEGDLLAGALAGGTEPIEGGEAPVTASLVDATLSTALFSGRGPGRLGVVHASFAAYLTARYLLTHEVPEHQLRALLTRTNNLGHTSVPSRLRETAAWLVALHPVQHRWLAEVDPDSIEAHAGLVNDGGVREALVAHLLDSPDPELRTRGRRWRLGHPRLAEQLRPALCAPLSEDAGPDFGHPVSRRARTALEIARRAGDRRVVEDLVDLVRSTGTNAYLRSAAAHALVDLDRDAASRTMRSVLDEVVEHPERDPDDELRGLALELNWPADLSASELVHVLARPQNRDLIGNYAMFLSHFLDNVSDDLLSELVRAVAPPQASATPPAEDEWVDEDDDVNEDGNPTAAAVSLLTGTRRGARVMTALVSRALDSTDLGKTVDEVGWLVATALNQHHQGVRLPARFDVQADDEEPDVTDLRHRLVLATLDHTPVSRSPYIAWHVEGSTQRGLVTGDDIEWLFSLATTRWADHAARLIRAVFDPTSVRQQEIAWGHHGEPIFDDSVAHWFKAIELDGDEAKQMRDEFKWSSRKQKVWSGASTHESALREAWDRCEQAADADSFYALCMRLRIDPQTGDGTYKDDLASWPSYSLVPADTAVLDKAAACYLATAAVSTDGWSDKVGTLPMREFVGYVALAYLARRDDAGAQLDALSDDVWKRWLPAILWFPIGEGFGDQRVNELLASTAAERVPDKYREWALRRTELQVQAGWHLGALSHPVPLYDDEVRGRLAALLRTALDAVTRARQDLYELAEPAADGDPPRPTESDLQGRLATARNNATVIAAFLVDHDADTETFLLDLVNGKAAPTAIVEVRVVAATALLTARPTEWDTVFATMQADEDFGRAMAPHLVRARRAGVRAHLTDEQLGALWSWLEARWSTVSDTFKNGFVSDDDQVREWRTELIAELESRATPGALAVLAGLVEGNPDNYRLRVALHSAELRDQDESWKGAELGELTALLENARRTIVHDDDSLYRLVLASLARFAARMERTGQMLWNETRAAAVDGATTKKVWNPKYEPDISAALKDHLDTEFGDRLVVNREVLVRQTTSKGHGLSVDVLATGASGDSAATDRRLPQCPIEMKGSWHEGLLTGLEAQLVDDYMSAARATRGVYVCAWFPIEQWDDEDDPRRAAAARRDRDQIAAELDDTARAISQSREMEVAAVVIDVPRPVASARNSDKNPTG